MINSEETTEIYLYIKKNDVILQEIFSRVKKYRKEFVKEAIVYWYFILKHSGLNTRNLYLKDEERIIVNGLFPKEYYTNRFSHSQHNNNIECANMTIRFNVNNDEEPFSDIFSRVASLNDYVREAVIEWDCLLNHSNLFMSRFIQKRSDTPKSWGDALTLSEYNTDFLLPGTTTSAMTNSIQKHANTTDVNKSETSKVDSNSKNEQNKQIEQKESSNLSDSSNKEAIITKNFENGEIKNDIVEKDDIKKTMLTRGKKNALSWG